MKYPIAIEAGSDSTAWGVVVPDLPGCFSAADSDITETLVNVTEAIKLWIEVALITGQVLPEPSSISALEDEPEFSGWTWMTVDIDSLAGNDSNGE